MKVQVETSGLVAAAERLRAAATQLTGAGVPVHPPLARDQTSVAAAARLSAAATALQSAAATHAAALIATAEHLVAIADGFTEQETANAAAVQALTSSAAPVGFRDLLAPVPTVVDDVRPPLPSPVEVDGEAVARQLYAGSPSAGSAFTQSWRSRSAAAVTARDMIRDVLPVLPDAWTSSSGTEAPAARLLRHSDVITLIADRAAALADQADSHARDYSGAIANTPKPAEFEAVRSQLRQALEANAKFPGQYTPLVSSLIAQQGALRQQSLNAQTEYHGHTEASTAPESPADGQMNPEQAGQSPASGRYPHAAALPGLLGAVGGMIGSAVSSAAQMPLALLQTGQQLAQAATQGLSGLATSAANGIEPAATDFGAASDVSHGTGVPGGPTESRATTPAGATDTTPVAPSTSSAPPPVTTPPQGAPPTATAPAIGTSAVPMGMPMGMLAPPAAADTGRQVAADKRIVVPVAPHTEPVTGRTTPDRLANRRPTKDEVP